MYERGRGPSFFCDAYLAQIKNDTAASRPHRPAPALRGFTAPRYAATSARTGASGTNRAQPDSEPGSEGWP